jgi:subtilisin family serine protease
MSRYTRRTCRLLLPLLFLVTAGSSNLAVWAAEPAPWWEGVVGAGKARGFADGTGITVAVIDSGVDLDHPALANRVVADGYNFGDCAPGRNPACRPGTDARPIDKLGHGTYVAGIIAASSAEVRGHRGLAPGARILPIKVNPGMMDDFSAHAVASAIAYARDRGAKVVNLSLNLPQVTGEERGLIGKSLHEAANAGVFIVVSAGNQAGDVVFPADHDDVIAVAGIGRKLSLDAHTSRRGPVVVAAPMEDIDSSLLGGGIGTRGRGTSFAAPFVSATLANMLQLKPDLSLAEARKILSASATPIGGGVGYGILNAGNALELISIGK